ncbi:MAG: DNA cytosine methyltransferase [Patescibacteria group bacterium]
MNKKLGYVSLFSSAGVGCYGFNLEGYDCIVTSELIQRRIDVQKHNNVCSLNEGYIAGDITDPTTHSRIFSAIRNWQKKNKNDEVDVIVATPPCQGISVANHKKKDELGRNSLVVESIKIINEIQSRYFIFENVRGFLNTVCTDIDGVNKSIQAAIQQNLGGNYNIAYRVLNFKEYGSNSSRTRTLVIGIRKDIEEVTPFELFPEHWSAPTLRGLISDLPKLSTMGEVSEKDIYHAFRTYNNRMLYWIKDTKEGQSAFDNYDELKRPHTVVDGKIIPNQNKNGDKYKRCYWDAVAPCVHTRNDILASQNTIHPEQPRVFSIRELMRFMSIPEEFKWSEHGLEELNSLSAEDKRLFLKKHEMNIRQCLGEGVPTGVFRSIANKIATTEARELLSLNKIKRLIEKNDLDKTEKLLQYLSSERPDFVTATKVAELANAKRLDDAAYYTRQDLCSNLVSDLPDFKLNKTIRILEPSVGVGNFLPTIFEKYRDKQKVHLDLVDISNDSIKVLKKVLKALKVPANFDVRIINADFLLHEFRNTYDLVVGNPPFGKVDASQFADYAAVGIGTSVKSRNIFALFYEKALKISDVVAFISPKSILNAPEFKTLRAVLEQYSIAKINDYGEKGFNGVKIETVSMQVNCKQPADKTVIESRILKSYQVHDQAYVIDAGLPYWLIYRDSYFDEMLNKLELGLFTVFRDRSLTSKNMKSTGKIRVLKSRNILNGDTQQLNSDQFVDSLNVSPIAQKFHNAKNIVVAPNLSYYPRATFLPKNTIVDGSAAILVPKRLVKLTKKDLAFFASKEYFLFYRIARNYATRSLNIDSSSVYFWGVPKDNLKHEIFEHETRSKFLFARPIELFEAFAA